MTEYTLFPFLSLLLSLSIFLLFSFLLEHRLGKVAHGLSHAQITQNLLGPAQDRVKLVGAVKDFNVLAHARLGQAAAAPDLDRLVGNLVGGAGAAHLEQANGARELVGLRLVRHVAHLVRDGLEPRLVGFDEGNHFCEATQVSFSFIFLSLDG